MKIRFATTLLVLAFVFTGCSRGGQIGTPGEVAPPVALPSVEGTTGTTTTTSEGALSETPVPPITYGLSVTVNGIGNVKSDSAGINCPPDCSKVYEQGTVVKLAATPDSLHKFDGWGIICVGTGVCNVTMDSNKVVAADFSPISTPTPKYRLDVVKSGSGTGVVTSAPAGIDCGTDCSEDYAPGTGVDLTATPNTGFVVGAWSVSSCVAGSTTCHVDMTADQMVKVAFDVSGGSITPTYNFSVNVYGTGTGAGKVTVTGLSDCVSASCPYTGLAAGIYALEAVPDSGSTFVGFAGGGCGTPTTCDFDLNSWTSGTTIQAKFASSGSSPTPGVSRSLLISISNGEGRVLVERTGVTPPPAAFECLRGATDSLPKECSNTYDSTDVVMLRAEPAPGFFFEGWGGDISSSVSPYPALAFDGNKVVKAVFKPFYTFSVTPVGPGYIQICPDRDCDPPVIRCDTGAGVCTYSYPPKEFTLRAYQNADGHFIEWNGDGCTGVTTYHCYFTLDSTTNGSTVEAKFGPVLELKPDLIKKPTIPPTKTDLYKEPKIPIDIGPGPGM